MQPPICYSKLWKCKSVIGGELAAEPADSDRVVESQSFCGAMKSWLLVLWPPVSSGEENGDKTARLSFAFLVNTPLRGILCIPFDVTEE